MGVGGNLSPGMLLSAYQQGVFPWFNPEDPILWWNPDPRFVLHPEDIHISSSMRRVLNGDGFRVSADTAFSDVIRACASTRRPGQRGTWITEDMELGYRRLHELGYAHSIECWEGPQLAGGLYGVSIGRMFFGESMFSHATNASKTALIVLARFVAACGFDLIDVQQKTPHLESMGAVPMPRAEFVGVVKRATGLPSLRGAWTESVASFLGDGLGRLGHQ